MVVIKWKYNICSFLTNELNIAQQRFMIKMKRWLTFFVLIICFIITITLKSTLYCILIALRAILQPIKMLKV